MLAEGVELAGSSAEANAGRKQRCQAQEEGQDRRRGEKGGSKRRGRLSPIRRRS